VSQAKNTLKKIASGDAYRNLETAIKEVNPQAIFTSYMEIAKQLEEADKEILEKIQTLPRANKDLDLQKFRSAFAARSQTMLPQWHWVDAELKKQKIMEGKVFGFGTKGDPLARTLDGKVVVVKGTTLKEGDKVRFKVVGEGGKIDFGRVFELTPDTFYLMLTQEAREKIQKSFDILKENIDTNTKGTAQMQLPDLSQTLRELEDIKEMAPRVGEEEKQRTIGRVLFFRRKLFKASIAKLVFEFLAQREEKEIADSCQRDQQKIGRALSAPGLFRYQSYESLRREFLAGDKPRGYQDILDKMENNLTSMDAALKLMDFKVKIEEDYPMTRRYFERIDRLFEKISVKAEQVAATLAEGNICDMSEIQAAIETSFSVEALGAEFRSAFRNATEYFNARAALCELRAGLGNSDSKLAEAAIEPYLRAVMDVAFRARVEQRS
jgi:chaperonin cofactor prefoldin